MKGHCIPGQTEVRGDMREVCSFILLISVCLSICMSVFMSLCLSLSLFYKEGAQKGHCIPGQTEVCGDTREVCIFVLLQNVCVLVCLSVYPFACLCPSFTKKELLRKDTAFLAKQKSVEIRERFVYLSCFKMFVCLSVCLYLCLFLSLSLFY